MKENIRAHIFVSGRVQGVMFRQSARVKAIELGIVGWAHNLIDGRVEIVCEGEKEKVGSFLEWCNKGSTLASVEHVDVSYEELKGEFKDFEVREFGF